MTAEAMDTAIKVGAFLVGIVVSVVSSVFAIGRKLGAIEEERKAEVKENGHAHSTLDERVRDAHRKADAAHKRIDTHDEKLARVEERGDSMMRRMIELQASMERLGDRIDELLMRLGKA